MADEIKVLERLQKYDSPYSMHYIAEYKVLNSKCFRLLKTIPRRGTYFVNDNETVQPTITIRRFEVCNCIDYLSSSVSGDQLTKETISMLSSALKIVPDDYDIIMFVQEDNKIDAYQNRK